MLHLHGCVEGLLAACDNTTVCAHCWSDGGFRPAACWLWQAEQMRADMLQMACCARRLCRDSSAVMRCLEVWFGQMVRAGDWGRGQALGTGSSPCAACITQHPPCDNAANRWPAWHLFSCCSGQQGWPYAGLSTRLARCTPLRRPAAHHLTLHANTCSLHSGPRLQHACLVDCLVPMRHSCCPARHRLTCRCCPGPGSVSSPQGSQEPRVTTHPYPCKVLATTLHLRPVWFSQPAGGRGHGAFMSDRPVFTHAAATHHLPCRSHPAPCTQPAGESGISNRSLTT